VLLVVAGVVGALVAIQLVVGAMAVAAHAWAQDLAADERLLPGTVVAGAEVGGQPLDQAREEVAAAVERRLREPITVEAGAHRWRLTPGELGASAASAEAVEQALSDAADAGPFTLARVRWFGGTVEVDVPLEVDEAQLREAVAGLADDVDREVRDATLSWDDGGVALVEHRDGHKLYRTELRRELAEAVRAGDDRVAGSVREQPAAVTTDEVAPLVERAERLAQRVMAHEVRVAAEGERWTVSPAEVGAEPDLERLTELLAGDADVAEATPGSWRAAPLAIPEEALADYVGRLAAELDVPAEDARLDWSDGWLSFHEHEMGEALDRDAAMTDVAAALRRGEHTVQLSVAPVEPDITMDDYEDVLLLRQNERRLYHYRDGQIAGDWPVAVGAGGSPTPTGVFHVGEKRYEPTWYNPDPDGWGAGMPEVVEPGPHNPLGVRALNWYRGGSDTLIRFHGTAATASIGRAASQGCVRLTNDDVVDVYDRVSEGTTIISIQEEPGEEAPVEEREA
jgi:vancomycin resistance protein YoaR